MTEELYRDDGYLKECRAQVEAVDERGIRVNRSVFYATGGGQPGDTGRLIRDNGDIVEIVDTRKDRESGEQLHLPAEGAALPVVGEEITLQIDWERRHRMMRMHSCMHLLCAVVPAPVTGGSVRDDGSARLDFDLPEPPDKGHIEQELNRLIEEDHPMQTRWIGDEELAANPDLVRTMSVQPPTGSGRVRLVHFEGVDLQPCGGTHVATTGEIGPVRIKKIQKKGKINRRITVGFDD